MYIRVDVGPDLRTTLHAYSFKPDEFAALGATLTAAGVPDATLQNIPPDDAGRPGVEVRLDRKATERIEKYLGVGFEPEGLTVQRQWTASPYRCVQIDLAGEGPECVTITAPHQNAATTKCALIAGQRGWFGGAAHPGSC